MVTLLQRGKVKGEHNCNIIDVKGNIVALWINVRKIAMSFVEVRRHFLGVTSRDLQIITPGRVILNTK